MGRHAVLTTVAVVAAISLAVLSQQVQESVTAAIPPTSNAMTSQLITGPSVLDRQ